MENEERIIPTAADLSRYRIAWNGSHVEMVLQCVECEKSWSPRKLKGGKLAQDWWHCPSGCNW